MINTLPDDNDNDKHTQTLYRYHNSYPSVPTVQSSVVPGPVMNDTVRYSTHSIVDSSTLVAVITTTSRCKLVQTGLQVQKRLHFCFRFSTN